MSCFLVFFFLFGNRFPSSFAPFFLGAFGLPAMEGQAIFPPCNQNDKTYINGYIAQLRPAHGMIQVVLAKVVLGQIGDIGELDMGNVRWS